MKRFIIRWFVFIMLLLPGLSFAFDPPNFVLEKVIGNVYAGKQYLPLYPYLSAINGTFLNVNCYVIASEDHSELVLIDVPGGAPWIPNQYSIFMSAIQDRFPYATIKAVLLTHDHIDHSWTVPDFWFSEIPMYASSIETASPPGPYDLPLEPFVTPISPGYTIPFDNGVIEAINLAGHTPGQLGYAFYPDGIEKKINWLFIGDALLAPINYGSDINPFNVTYYFRLQVLAEDTYSFEQWIDSLTAISSRLTKSAKVFSSHGPIRDGYFWKDPLDYIDFTIDTLEDYLP